MKPLDHSFYHDKFSMSKSNANNNHDSYYVDYKSLDRFFDGTMNSGFPPLDNNIGQISAQKLADCIVSILFPRTGVFVNVEKKENTTPDNAVETTKRLRENLAESTFYESVGRLVKEIIVYGFGYVTVFYDDMLIYENPLIKDIFFINSKPGNIVFFYQEVMTVSDAVNRYSDFDSSQYAGETDTQSQVKVTQCYLPNKKSYLKETMKGDYQYVRIDITEDKILNWSIDGMDGKGFTTCPFIVSNTQLNRSGAGKRRSLGSLALVKTEDANWKESEYNYRSQLANRAPVEVDINALNENRVSFYPESVIPLNKTERETKFMKLENELNIDINMIAKSEQDVREIFMFSLIEQVDAMVMNTPEEAKVYLNFLNKVAAIVGDVVNGPISSLIKFFT